MKNYILVCLIFSVGVFLRFYKIDEQPLPAFFDETVNINNARALSLTGKDINNNAWPALISGANDDDHRAALYAWVCAIWFKIFPSTLASARSFSALLGCLTLLLLFLFCKEWKGMQFATISLFAFGFSPWHITLSRLAVEATATYSLIIVSLLYFSQRIIKKNYPIGLIILLGLVVGLSSEIYHPLRVLAVLYCVVVGLYFLFNKNIEHRIGKLFVFGTAAFIAALPQIISMIFNTNEFMSRANNALLDFREIKSYALVPYNFLTYFNPNLLFIHDHYYNSFSFKRALLVEMPFYYIGLIVLFISAIKTKDKISILIFILYFLCLLPTCLSSGNPMVVRVNGIVVLLPIFTILGLFFITEKLNSHRVKWLGLFSIILFFNFGYWLRSYLEDTDLQQLQTNNQLVQVATESEKIESEFDQIFVDTIQDMLPHYIFCFSKLKPKEIQNCKPVLDERNLIRYPQVGKYTFCYDGYNKSNLSAKSLLISKKKFPELELLKEITIPQQPIIYFYR